MEKRSLRWLKKDGRNWVPISDAAKLEGITYHGMVALVRRGKREADHWLSTALIELGRDSEALTVLDRILALNPDHPTPYAQLGRVYLKQNELIKAQAAFEESIQINPFNPEVHIGLADAYAKLGEHRRSEQEKNIAQNLRR